MKKTKSRKRKLKVLSIGLQFPIGLPFSRQTARVFQQCPFTLFCWTLKWKSMQKYYQNAKREKSRPVMYDPPRSQQWRSAGKSRSFIFLRVKSPSRSTDGRTPGRFIPRKLGCYKIRGHLKCVLFCTTRQRRPSSRSGRAKGRRIWHRKFTSAWRKRL